MKYILICIFIKNNNLITYKGILFFFIFIKNKKKINILLLKLGFIKDNYLNNKNINDFFYEIIL